MDNLAADRLTASGAMTYGYDANGNQTSKTVRGVTTIYDYDSLNRLTSITGGTSYTYNADGLGSARLVTNQLGVVVVGSQQHDAR